MYWSNISSAVLCLVFGCVNVLEFSTSLSECEAQGGGPDYFSENSRKVKSGKTEKAVPFADYENRLRQSPGWAKMNPEERVKALETIEQARKKFLLRQQELNTLYEEPLKKLKKPRESLISKRRKREIGGEKKTLWQAFQELPQYRRHEWEETFGLLRFTPSQRPKKLQNIVDKMPFSKRTLFLRELKQSSSCAFNTGPC